MLAASFLVQTIGTPEEDQRLALPQDAGVVHSSHEDGVVAARVGRHHSTVHVGEAIRQNGGHP